MATSADRMTAILPPTEDATVIYKALKDVKKMLRQGQPFLTPREVRKLIYKLAVDVHDLARSANQTEWGKGVKVSTIEQE